MTPSTIWELVDRQADRSPDKVFLHFGDQVFSFGRLAEDARRIASALADSGIGPGDRIAVLMYNQPEYVRFLLGAAAAGVVTVSINTMLKTAELHYILADSGACAVVTGSRMAKTISGLKDRLPAIKQLWLAGSEAEDFIDFEQLLNGSDRPPAKPPAPYDDAALIYTSGTSGRPKGAVLTHENFLANSQQVSEALGLTGNDQALCVLPLFHVNAQVVSLFAPYFAGGSLLLMRGFSPMEMTKAIAQTRPTIFSAVPTVYAILANIEADPAAFDSIRLFISGSAPLSEKVRRDFEKKWRREIVEGYGLSEATCACTFDDPEDIKPGSVGRPLPGQKLKIVDLSGQGLGPDEVGEVLVSGPNIMRAYHNDPEATAATLQDGWLHTGDLGQLDGTGRLYLAGRKKDMIIRGGENIYPPEVERTLLEHPAVTEAAVCGLADEIWGEQVVAFLVLKETVEVSRDEIIAFCHERLADFKCPGRIEFIDELPKTADGEVHKPSIIEQFGGPATG